VEATASGVIGWFRSACGSHELLPLAVLTAKGDDSWPLQAANESELRKALAKAKRLAPLPKEPAALANVLEVSVVDFLLERLSAEVGVRARRGTERGYPDIELSVGDTHFAVDFKAARRGKSRKQTESRITLCTGNTYFRYPKLHWPNTFRSFESYAAHIEILAIYTLNEESTWRVDDLEFIIDEMWRFASKQRSSTTREYIGAVVSLEALRAGKGEFETEEEFQKFWRKFPFKIGRTVQQQLDRLLKDH
jgi:Restriction endonuclease EcoRV